MEKILYSGHNLTRWSVGKSTFLAFPEKGARLMNWNLTLGDGTVRDVIHWPEGQSLDDIHKARGGNPILFPFSGRSFDQGEILFWRDARGIRRPMPLHGIARQGDFRVVKMDPAGFEAVFVPGEEAKACYPFDYEFTVVYRFAPLGLTCEMTLVNLGRDPLPWSAGHHFYFTAPWSEGLARRDYLIRIPAGRHTRQDKTGQLFAAPALAQDTTLDNPDLIDTQHWELSSNEVVFGEKGRPGDVAVAIGTSPVPAAGSTFVTWTLADDSPFYCVEPWMGPPNAVEHKTGLHFVPPGKRETFTVTVSVR